MGLDIYLYKMEDLEKSIFAEKTYEEESQKNWEKYAPGEYENLTEEQKEAAKEADEKLAKTLNLDKWGSSLDEEGIELPSKKHPENICKIGYFRSSYNGSGMDRVISNVLGEGYGLDYIFEHKREDYKFIPNWEESLVRANELLSLWNKSQENGSFGAFEEQFISDTVSSEESALKAFLAEKEKYDENMKKFPDRDMHSYMNGTGVFYMKEPMKVRSIIIGKSSWDAGRIGFSLPGTTGISTYIVFDADYTYVTESLEVVIETIEWVLEQDEKEKYGFHWSG